MGTSIKNPKRVALLMSFALAAAVAADPPISAGRFNLSVVGAYGASIATVRGLPKAGRLETVVSIGHVDRAKMYFDGGQILLRQGESQLRLVIAKEDHGMWPVTAWYHAKGEEPQSLELHLVGIAPTQTRSLRIVWSATAAPRLLFGDHQEVEFGAVGFAPESIQIQSSFGWLVLDDLRILEAGAP